MLTAVSLMKDRRIPNDLHRELTTENRPAIGRLADAERNCDFDGSLMQPRLK